MRAPRSLALAAATVTLAGSTAAAIAAVALEAYRLARTIAERISPLLDALSHAATTAGALVAGMRHTAADARAGALYMQEPLGQVPAAQVVEAGKQFSGTALENPPPEQTTHAMISPSRNRVNHPGPTHVSFDVSASPELVA